MRNLIAKYQLKTGLLVAVLFPGIFVFAEAGAAFDPARLIFRFISSFLCIFLVWLVCFRLVDFKTKTQLTNGQRYMRLALSFLFSIALYLFVGLVIDRTGTLLTQVAGDNWTSFRAWFFLCLRIALFNGLIVLIKYLYDSSHEKQAILMENEILKRENLNALHETLRQQVNPHFLFNSLNTLKSLVKLEPDQAVNFTNELASVYRYMLRHQDKQEVTLREEIEFLQSYLYLMKIRFGEAIQTHIRIPDSFLESSMPPNTLQLLMENAVKHNALSLKKPLAISLFANEDYLVVENTLQPKNLHHTSSSHLGLSNIKSRYTLMKGKEVIIKKLENRFQVLLPV